MKNLLLVFLLVFFSSCETEKVRIYYESGEIRRSGQTKSGLKVGLWTDYYENGLVKSKVSYNDIGNADGECLLWHPNGELKMKSHCVNGRLDGTIQFWYANGKLKTEGIMKDDKKHGLWLRHDSITNRVDSLPFMMGAPVY